MAQGAAGNLSLYDQVRAISRSKDIPELDRPWRIETIIAQITKQAPFAAWRSRKLTLNTNSMASSEVKELYKALKMHPDMQEFRITCSKWMFGSSGGEIRYYIEVSW